MSKKRITRRTTTITQAFATGLSGFGMLVTPTTKVHALQRGATLDAAWSNVGRYLDRAAAKQLNERRKQTAK